MGVYIKGMEMPKSCFACPFRRKVDPDNIMCIVTREEFEETFAGTIETRNRGNCPLVPVPEHGRLIDADGEIGVNVTMMPGGKCRVDLIAPTIIPAEEEET